MDNIAQKQIISKRNIEDFFGSEKIAIVGVSSNKKKFGYTVFRDLRTMGYHIVPVNPKISEIDGVRCYQYVSELDDDIKSLLIITPKEITDTVLEKAIEMGIPNIWVQQMSETKQTLSISQTYKGNFIYKKCIYMFAGKVKGMHLFHRNVLRLFGKLPK